MKPGIFSTKKEKKAKKKKKKPEAEVKLTEVVVKPSKKKKEKEKKPTVPEPDKIKIIQQELEETKAALRAGLNEAVRRGETLESLEKTVEDLTSESKDFARTAKTVKYASWARNIMIALTVAGLLMGLAAGSFLSVAYYERLFTLLIPFLIGGLGLLGAAVMGSIGWGVVEAVCLLTKASSKVEDALDVELGLPMPLKVAATWLPSRLMPHKRADSAPLLGEARTKPAERNGAPRF